MACGGVRAPYTARCANELCHARLVSAPRPAHTEHERNGSGSLGASRLSSTLRLRAVGGDGAL